VHVQGIGDGHGHGLSLPRHRRQVPSAAMTEAAPVDVTGRPPRLLELDLAGFFSPRTVAVIGASDDRRRPNAAMTRKIVEWAERHGATVYPVNPNPDEIDG